MSKEEYLSETQFFEDKENVETEDKKKKNVEVDSVETMVEPDGDQTQD